MPSLCPTLNLLFCFNQNGNIENYDVIIASIATTKCLYNFVQNFIKICKTLAGALTHTCTLCMHLHCTSPPLQEREYVTLFLRPPSVQLWTSVLLQPKQRNTRNYDVMIASIATITNFVQKFVVICKTLAGALMHACTLCTHLHPPLPQGKKSFMKPYICNPVPKAFPLSFPLSNFEPLLCFIQKLDNGEGSKVTCGVA